MTRSWEASFVGMPDAVSGRCLHSLVVKGNFTTMRSYTWSWRGDSAVRKRTWIRNTGSHHKCLPSFIFFFFRNTIELLIDRRCKECRSQEEFPNRRRLFRSYRFSYELFCFPCLVVWDEHYLLLQILFHLTSSPNWGCACIQLSVWGLAAYVWYFFDTILPRQL